MRTYLQHLWAEVSEKFADVIDPAIKYGKGDESVRTVLTDMSENVAKIEALEERWKAMLDDTSSIVIAEDSRKSLSNALLSNRESLRKVLEEAITDIARSKGGTDVVSD